MRLNVSLWAIIFSVMIISAVPVQAALFSGYEEKSNDISVFTKWTRVVERLRPLALADLAPAGKVGGVAVLDEVNRRINRVTYVSDYNNWKKTDYWATPDEFFARGGDCEDFAIAKFATLEAAGFAADTMRLVVLYNNQKQELHAVLAVHYAGQVYILDNESNELRTLSQVPHYRLIYAINRDAWWRYS